ncbi:MAG: Asp-tRNA(Asn)/Glu-tRNA(Gln) amidotransferase subunit GatB [Erysipelotrichaceae bacterium]|nr:Asp-tRNA(Asn)/Glu-tRNA(Gln) amidotransferase subunit GatB [Erysipelotrichaceae bacterium]
MEYDVVVGIEIHLELTTNTKMFSGAPYKFKSEANTCTNEIDLGHPGTLPCVNMEAVKKAIMTCFALNLDIDKLIKFDRKNYYYSDLPKGFQITQQFHPIGKNGYIEIYVNGGYKKIRINRAHMEEDTAKQFHLYDETLIDFNRAGVPLLEIVSEPDIASGEEAALYVEKLRQTLDYLGVSDVKMEEGSLRCDVNVSIKPKGSNEFGTKVEVKNLNSIANVKDAIDFEANRQAELLEKGEKIVQETRRFDEKTMSTVSMRLKESSVDYKYFPEPNIFPIKIDDAWINSIKEAMPELPDAKSKRYLNEYKLSEYDTNLLLANKMMSSFFDEAMKSATNPKNLCNLLTSELVGLLQKDETPIEKSPVTPVNLAKLSNILDKGEISSKQAKEVLEEMLSGKDPETIINEKGIKQVSNQDEILKIVKEVLDENPQSIEDFKNGKDRALGFMVGQVMKKSKGQANPKMASELLTKELSER